MSPIALSTSPLINFAHRGTWVVENLPVTFHPPVAIIVSRLSKITMSLPKQLPRDILRLPPTAPHLQGRKGIVWRPLRRSDQGLIDTLHFQERGYLHSAPATCSKCCPIAVFVLMPSECSYQIELLYKDRSLPLRTEPIAFTKQPPALVVALDCMQRVTSRGWGHVVEPRTPSSPSVKTGGRRTGSTSTFKQ
jgi:hypothetical protein